MDVTPIYIAMCRQAKKFLPRHKWQEGDWFVWTKDIKEDTIVHNWWIDKGSIDIYKESNWDSSELITSTNAFPIYRQDQLQEMYQYGPPSAIHEFHRFMESRYNTPDDAVEDATIAEVVFETWEQLWLGFIMHEKYGKVWDGKEWVVK